MDDNRCPRCHESTALSGHMMSGQEGFGAPVFAPLHVARFRGSEGVPITAAGAPFHACLSCGHLWSTLDPARLRDFIATHGNELARQQIEDFTLGPNCGLPDVAPAREAAAKVAEIDALARAGKPLEATRRYHDLSGVKWDLAIKEARNWQDLRRDQKLALFHWVTKDLAPVDDLAEPLL